jgi:hypothetical protein
MVMRYFKYIKVLLEMTYHQSIQGTKTIWRENRTECIVLAILAFFHTMLSLFCSGQKEARLAYSGGLLMVGMVLTITMLVNQKQTKMFAFWYSLWVGVAAYWYYCPITF